MKILTKRNIPFISLLIMACSWVFYYQSSTLLNDFGSTKPEWLLVVDGLIFLPILCFICIKDRKEAAVKALAYSCLVILLGSLVIPENSKLVWHYLESGRYLAIAVFVTLEIITIFTVIFAIKAQLNQGKDPDLAISQPIESILGKGAISALLSFEARVWTYALFTKRVNRNDFHGEKHFSCHMKDGTQSNLLGFILIIVFELPIMHLVLHFLWSPISANVISIMTLIGLVFFIAEYRAISIRPISITSTSIIVRYGVWNPLTIPFDDIVSVQLNTKTIRRAHHIKRFNLSGQPNVEIKLDTGKLIYLGLDSPNEFLSSLIKR
ncbi:PH domain-containing protein [Shewanella woodyi]|uniref:Uncharacterized protein n=1 Tax=Shewanella woodyi (strain ATCC 51908 / MS32) TaxID=392500 RepID=B1KGQ1_SHEWM|nr:PH domain-containing protein [Shewanella woodyi]ACA85379.1 hypothetical protein Swoo_1086 [Shewanella woodyi ATCC 51908]